MPSIAVRANFFDASALVKVYVDEPSGEIVREYFHREPTKYTTPFCFYETLNVLKGKWLKGVLVREKYLLAAFQLTAWYGGISKSVEDLDFTSVHTFLAAKKIVETTALDLSDAFQILSVRDGYFSRMARDSRTVFVTADKTLANEARRQGLRVWDVTNEAPP